MAFLEKETLYHKKSKSVKYSKTEENKEIDFILHWRI